MKLISWEEERHKRLIYSSYYIFSICSNNQAGEKQVPPAPLQGQETAIQVPDNNHWWDGPKENINSKNAKTNEKLPVCVQTTHPPDGCTCAFWTVCPWKADILLFWLISGPSWPKPDDLCTSRRVEVLQRKFAADTVRAARQLLEGKQEQVCYGIPFFAGGKKGVRQG